MSSTNPYNYPFIQKDNTMYLSTISTPPYIQPNKISPASPPSIVKAHSNKEISLARPRRSSFLKAAPQTSNSPPTLNPSLIEASTFKRHPILSTSMTSRVPDQNAPISEPGESSIHYAPSICYLQPLKSSSTMDVSLLETLSSVRI